MAELNPNLIVFGVKQEAVRGTAETLVEADFNQAFLDAEQIQYAPDHAKAGKAANGTLINTAKSYSRTRGGATPIKMEVKALVDPTVAPNYFETIEVMGFKTGIIDAGTNDNVEFYYDGKPSCASATIESRVYACDGSSYIKSLKGAVIADTHITIEGAGAPLLINGTATGAFNSPSLSVAEITPTEDAGDCIQGSGMTALLGGTLWNFTKIDWAVNLSGTGVTDFSDASLFSHFNLAEGGEPTFTFSAIPVQATADQDWSDLFDNVVDTELILENDDVKIIIDMPQTVDIQDMNETGVGVKDKTFDSQGIRVQYK